MPSKLDNRVRSRTIGNTTHVSSFQPHLEPLISSDSMTNGAKELPILFKTYKSSDTDIFSKQYLLSKDIPSFPELVPLPSKSKPLEKQSPWSSNSTALPSVPLKSGLYSNTSITSKNADNSELPSLGSKSIVNFTFIGENYNNTELPILEKKTNNTSIHSLRSDSMKSAALPEVINSKIIFKEWILY
jgi:hypothetical protein